LTGFVSGFSRLALLIFYFSRPLQWNVVFKGSFILPCLGFLFLPFTTMVYVWLLQGVGSIQGFNWVWLGLAALSDLASLAGAGYANRDRIPGTQGTMPTA
jgi:hypothetical protein